MIEESQNRRRVQQQAKKAKKQVVIDDQIDKLLMAGGPDTGKVSAQNAKKEELDLFEELDAPRNTGSDDGKEDADDTEYGREADFHGQYAQYLKAAKQNHDENEEGDEESQIGNSYANEQRLAGGA